MTVLHVVFGDVLPMTLAVEHPERYSSWVNRPVKWLSVLVWPFRALLGGLAALTLRVVGSERQQGEPEISEEELRTPVDAGARGRISAHSAGEMAPKPSHPAHTPAPHALLPR